MPRQPLPIGTYGNINTRQTGPKAWKANTYYRDSTGKRRRLERWGTSKAAAVSKLKMAIVEEVAPLGENVLNRDSKFRAVADAWHEEITEARELSTSTVRLYREGLDKHLFPQIGERRIRECDPYCLSTALKNITVKHGATTANRAHSVLRNVFKFCVSNGITGTNPARDIPKATVSSKPVVALSLEDVRRLLSQLSGECLVVAQLQVATGLRIGEALALRWRDVDLDASPPRITVTGTAVASPDGGYMRGKPKTLNSHRTIPIPQALADALRSWSSQVPVHARSTSWATPDAMVFPNSRGGVKDPNNYRKAWRTQTAQAGFSGLETHALRKTASTLIERAYGPSVAAETLGDTEAVALKHYIQRRDMTVDVTDVTGDLLATGDSESGE